MCLVLKILVYRGMETSMKKLLSLILSMFMVTSNTLYVSASEDSEQNISVSVVTENIQIGEQQRILINLSDQSMFNDIILEESFLLLEGNQEKVIKNIIREGNEYFIELDIDESFQSSNVWLIKSIHLKEMSGSIHVYEIADASFQVILNNDNALPSMDDVVKEAAIDKYEIQNKSGQEPISNIKTQVYNGRFTITADISPDVTNVSFPTWTSANGQDDIIWEEGTIYGNTVTYTVDMKDHNYETGEYITHIYVDQGDDVIIKSLQQEMIYTKPNISDVRVEKKASSYTITASVDGYDLKYVQFPTWTRENGQDDITWEHGELRGDTITYTVNMSDHNNETGIYDSHIYLYDGKGNYSTAIVPEQEIENENPVIENIQVKKENGKYIITADVKDDLGIAYVQFPTWTLKDGQDDITWEKGIVDNGKVTYTVDMKDHNFEKNGYLTHIYVYDLGGKLTIKEVPLQSMEYSKPSIENLKIDKKEDRYTITFQAFGYDLSRAVFPTWTSANGQDDITWAEGVIDHDTVTYTVYLRDHGNELGEYNTHIYLYDATGEVTIASIAPQIYQENKPVISDIKITNAAGKYTISAKVNDESGIDYVQFPTWTSVDGQDDITWEKGKIEGDLVTYTVDMKDHNFESGAYNTHIYAYNKQGKLATAILPVQTIINEAPVIKDVKVKRNNGTYTITAVVSDDYDLDYVQFPTWTSANGQDDITWEKGVITGNTVSYTVNIKDHNFEAGSYFTHIYAYDRAGRLTTAAVPEQNMIVNPPKITNIAISDIDVQGYLITCNVEDELGLDYVQFPTWSSSNGQDDITWENGTIQGNKVTYRVSIKDHNYDFGDYISHIYAYNKAGKSTIASAPAVSILPENTPGWHSVSDKKYLIDADGGFVGFGKQIVDISQHNGAIDWEVVKNSGVDGVILRSGYGYEDDLSQMDSTFKMNVAELERLHIPYGIYHFSYATTPEEGADEAEYVLKCLEEAGAKPTLPIYYDLEYSDYVGVKDGAFYEKMTNNFANVIQKAGYTVGVYANYNWWTTKLTGESFQNYQKWVAHYGLESNNVAGTANPDWHPTSEYKIWQYTSCGNVMGIGSNVDMNILFD